MPQNNAIRLRCHDCSRPTQHEILSEQSKPEPAETDLLVLSRTYQIVQCRGCETVSFRELIPSANGTAENLYPPRMIRAPEDYSTSRAPVELVGIYDATIGAFNAGAGNLSSFILCAGGIRCMLELICLDLGIGGASLEDKVAGLEREGHLTLNATRGLQDARFLGNEALHEGEVPSQNKLAEVIDIFEFALQSLYVQPERFHKNELLWAVVTEVLEDGLRVRIGKSTQSLIPISELGLEPEQQPSVAAQPRQRIEVKVLSDRDDPLLLSKKAVDGLRKREAEAQRKKDELERIRKIALRQLRQGDFLEGTVTEVLKDGVVVQATKGAVVIAEGWIPSALFEARGRSAYGKGMRIPLLVAEVRPNDSWLVLSHRDGLIEESYLRAEKAYREKSILEGSIVDIQDGKVVVRIGPGCRGIVAHSQLGDGTTENLSEWKDRRIAVRVVGAPVANRRAPLQLSHRSAVKRRESLAQFELGQQATGKVGKVWGWGAIVAFNGVDGLLTKADMTSRSVREDSEIQVEVAELDRDGGYLGLKLVSTDGTHPESVVDSDDSDESRFQPEDDRDPTPHEESQTDSPA